MGNVFGSQTSNGNTPNYTVRNEARPLIEALPRPGRGVYTDDLFGRPAEPEIRGTSIRCRFCNQSGCFNGSTCRTSQRVPTNLASTGRSRKPCYFYAKGHCKKGDLCRFSHTKAIEGYEENTIRDAGIPGDDHVRELGGVWAEFGDGASIVSVTLPSDFSAIRISNLPRGFTQTSVKKLLSNVNLVISEQDVQLINSNMSTSISVIKVNDPTFAKAACKRLPTLLEAQAYGIAAIPVPMPMGSGICQVRSRQVSCSWFRPTRTAYLDFETKAAAHRVCRNFRSGSCKVNGFQVKVGSDVTQVSQYSKPHWRIKLANLVDLTDERDIITGLAASDKPQQVSMGEPTYVADTVMDSTLIQSLLDGFGPIERWQFFEDPKGMSYKAYATFLQDSDAQDAVSSLSGASLPFCKENKLILRLIASVRFRISMRVYTVVKKRVDAMKDVWRRRHIRFFAFPPRGPHAILLLEGDNRQHLAQAREEMDKIIAGHVMSVDGKDLWYADLKISRHTYGRLQKIEKELGVVIMPDIRASQTRVFGPEEMVAPATEALHNLIQQSTSTTHSLLLHEPGDMEWFKGGGRYVLEAEFGTDKIVFDNTARCLRINGSEENLVTAKLMLARRQLKQTPKAIQTNPICSICWTEAEEPVQTSCGHVYCALCFTNMCQAEASSSKEFRIKCSGNSDSCGRVLPFSEIQNLLLSEVFENILEASFKSYIRRSPDQFRNCPTPDCTQVYRVTSAGSSITSNITCPKCIAVICTGCFTSHAGAACQHKEDEAFAKVKEKLGIQDCPKCKASIERSAGCNHMECKICGTHMCWLCLAAFDTSGLCYAHMRSSHGGYI